MSCPKDVTVEQCDEKTQQADKYHGNQGNQDKNAVVPVGFAEVIVFYVVDKTAAVSEAEGKAEDMLIALVVTKTEFIVRER